MPDPAPERLPRFTPGTAVALVGDRVVCLVVDDPRSELVRQLWSAIASRCPADELLDLLAGFGLRELPSFGLVSVEDGAARVLVRGQVAASPELVEPGAPGTITARGVHSWVEEVRSDVRTVQLHLDGDLSEPGAFEIGFGIVPAGRIEVPVATPREPHVVPDGPDEADPPAADLDEAEAPGEPSPEDPVDERAEPVDTSEDHPVEPDGTPGTGSDADPGSGGEPSPAAADNDTLVGPFDDHDEVEPVDPIPPSDGGADHVDVGADQLGDDRVADDYDHLFGATQFRTVEDAAVRPETDDLAGTDGAPLISSIPAVAPGGPPPRPAAPDAFSQDGPDHDGHTISLAELHAERASAPVDDVGDRGGAPMVHAVRCPAGHLNPTHATSCRTCGAAVEEQEHVTVPRPVLGVLRFSDGRAVELDRPLLLGRAPKADGAVGGELPQLVTVPSPLKEVSGTHLEVRLEGWQVLVVDRRSTNGTTVSLPGRDPERLRPGEPFPITVGTSVDLAEESQFVFEACP